VAFAAFLFFFANRLACRSVEKLQGTNFIHFGEKFANYVTLPVIPPKSVGTAIASALGMN